MRFVLIFFTLVACFAQKSEDTSEGREIYNRSCTMCHGQDEPQRPWTRARRTGTCCISAPVSDLFDAIKNGIAGTLMPASPLPAADVSKIVAYIRSLRSTPRSTRPFKAM